MKAIFEYTIYCTKTQVEKALKLGARISYRSGDKPFVSVEYLDEDGGLKYHNYDIPTTEQMIGWLEEQDGIDEITVCKTGMWIWGKNHTLIEGGSRYSSRKESSLAAVDAALNYLEQHKK